MARNVADIRNIAVCGHGSSGKTTLVDQLLVKTGAVNGHPSVDAGTSICDFDEEEKHHKHSIEATVVHFDHDGKHFNVIDTPGYPDLIGADDRRAAGGRHGPDRDRRPRRHQGQHPPRLAGSGRRRPGPHPLHHQARHRQHRLPAARSTRSRKCSAPAVRCSTCRSATGTNSRASSARSTSAQRHRRCADRSGRASARRCSSRSSKPTKQSWRSTSRARCPRKEELDRLTVQAVAAGTLTPIVCVSTKTGVGIDELLDVLAQCRAAAVGGRAQGQQGRRRRHAQARPGRPAGGPGVQDPDRSVRAAAEFHPRLLRHAQEGQHVDSPGPSQGHQDRPAARRCRPTRPTNVDEAGPGRHRGGGQVRRAAHRHVAGRGGTAADRSSRRRWSAWPSRPRPAATKPSSPARCTKSPKKTARPPEHDAGDQGNGAHRHERAASDAAPRAAQAPRQGRGRDQGAEDSLPRNDPGQRRGKLPAQEADRAAPASSAKSTSACIPFPKAPSPRNSPPRTVSRSSRSTHYHEKNNFLWVDTVVGGTIPGNFMPAIEKGFLERINRRRDRRLSGAERLRRGPLRQRPPGRLERNGVQDRRPARRSPRCSKKRGRACWSRWSSSRSPCPSTTWATFPATSRAAAVRWSAWTRPAAA